MLTLVYFIIRKRLEVTGKTELCTCNDEPLCWIPLVPFDGIAIVHRKLMVKIVVSFPKSDESGKKVIARCQFIVKCRFS